MTELERRALLGDKQAQKECTENGILLPCPFCGAEKTKVRYVCGDCFVECLKCHCTSSMTSTKETVIKDWNTRPAPPIGRCGECALEDVCLNCTEGNGFCSDFVSKDKYK